MKFTFLTQNQEALWVTDRQMKTHPILFPFFNENIIARLRHSLTIVNLLFAIQLISFVPFSRFFTILTPFCYFSLEFNLSPRLMMKKMRRKIIILMSIHSSLHRHRHPGCTSSQAKTLLFLLNPMPNLPVFLI